MSFAKELVVDFNSFALKHPGRALLDIAGDAVELNFVVHGLGLAQFFFQKVALPLCLGNLQFGGPVLSSKAVSLPLDTSCCFHLSSSFTSDGIAPGSLATDKPKITPVWVEPQGKPGWSQVRPRAVMPAPISLQPCDAFGVFVLVPEEDDERPNLELPADAPLERDQPFQTDHREPPKLPEPSCECVSPMLHLILLHWL